MATLVERAVTRKQAFPGEDRRQDRTLVEGVSEVGKHNRPLKKERSKDALTYGYRQEDVRSMQWVTSWCPSSARTVLV